MRNTTAMVMRILGWMDIGCGFIAGIVSGNAFKTVTISSSLYGSAKESFNWGLFCAVVGAGIVSGLLFLAVSEIIELLNRSCEAQEAQAEYMRTHPYGAAVAPPSVAAPSPAAHTVTPSSVGTVVSHPVAGKIKCVSCGEHFDNDRNSCPHCGNRVNLSALERLSASPNPIFKDITPKKQCPACKKTFEADRTGCPHCGAR